MLFQRFTPDQNNACYFGQDICIDKDRLAIAVSDCEHNKFISIYCLQGTEWVLEMNIENPVTPYSSCFSWPGNFPEKDFRLSGNRLVNLEAAINNNGQTIPALDIHVFNGTDWIKETTITSPFKDSETIFANQFDIEDDILTAIAIHEPSSFTYLYIFKYMPWGWQLDQFFHGFEIFIDPHSSGSLYIANQNITYSPHHDANGALIRSCPQSDLTGDCRTDMADMSILIEHWLDRVP
jgi:hypothetical protein